MAPDDFLTGPDEPAGTPRRRVSDPDDYAGRRLDEADLRVLAFAVGQLQRSVEGRFGDVRAQLEGGFTDVKAQLAGIDRRVRDLETWRTSREAAEQRDQDAGQARHGRLGLWLPSVIGAAAAAATALLLHQVL